MSNLTLSDQEQRELYEAAQIIQKAYRSYKGRKGCFRGGKSSSTVIQAGQEKEAKAAIVIQNYYRRYKQVRLLGYDIGQIEIEKCIVRESNPGRPRGRRAFYH